MGSFPSFVGSPVNMSSAWMLISVVSDSWQSFGLQPTRLLCPLGSPGKNTGMGCYSWGPSHLRIESASLTSPALVGRFFTSAPPGKPL